MKTSAAQRQAALTQNNFWFLAIQRPELLWVGVRGRCTGTLMNLLHRDSVAGMELGGFFCNGLHRQ